MEQQAKKGADKGNRTGFVWTGIILCLIARALSSVPVVSIFVWIVGVSFLLTGCYVWTRLKNRCWAFMFWGLLAPIGLLGLCCLRDKSEIKDLEVK